MLYNYDGFNLSETYFAAIVLNNTPTWEYPKLF